MTHAENPVDAKAQLRARIAADIRRLDSETRRMASDRLCQRLIAATGGTPGIIMAMLPMPDEIDLMPFLAAMLDRGLAVPQVDWQTRTMRPVRVRSLEAETLRTGRHGVRLPVTIEPIAIDAVSLIIVPGVAFDSDGHRLGRGGGFYDRLLDPANAQATPPTIGIGFDEQVIEHIPTERWDRQVDRVITPGSDSLIDR